MLPGAADIEGMGYLYFSYLNRKFILIMLVLIVFDIFFENK